MTNKVIEMINIKKSFGTVQAISNGNFNLYPGEVHSLVGENGAGKSTLLKILYGMHNYDEGKMIIKGNEYNNLTPKEAIGLGIGMVHQEFMLVQELTVLENIILGFEPNKGINIDLQKAKKVIKEYIDLYGMDVQLNKKVKNISVGEAQRVEIIKTLYRGTEILILDEPTAVLTPQETVQLFKILEALKKDGKSIIFISHKLKEVMEISDRVTVMRQGAYLETFNKKDTSIAEIARMMVGRDVFLNSRSKPGKTGQVVLQIKNTYIPGDREISKIRGLSLNIKEGEVLGIAGVDGNGQTELIEAITGLRKVEKGSIIFLGKEIQNLSPLKIRQAGVAHVPEDRNVRGLNREWSIKDNLIANKFYKKPFSEFIRINKTKVSEHSKDLINKFDIRPKDGEILTKNLSGGNAQKVIVARELDMGGKLLIAAQPTRGVDIGSIEEIRRYLDEAKKNNTAILLVSADLGEILALSDRIAVMYEGKITGIINSSEATEENLGILMVGGKLNE
ncbi:ABC transporter ATP-binding protein [Clostridium algidicarnis]|uniref:ABC transporter ATP-binding protein n=1 Tax=Clostridium algidicarnis TaxID=37659 RepID=UPI003FD7B170